MSWMQADNIDFAALIENDRIERQRQEWQGTFLEYLELVKAQPSLADLAHRRMYNMMIDQGVAELDLEADPRAKRFSATSR
jgi:serine protein kinase